MSMSKFRNIKNEPAADNSIAKTNEPIRASKNNLSSSIQGIKFLNFPLFNEEMGKSSPACPRHVSCSNEHNCSSLKFKRKEDIKETSETDSISLTRRP